MKNAIRLSLILLLAVCLDFMLISLERHFGICQMVYRNDVQEYNLYNKQYDQK